MERRILEPARFPWFDWRRYSFSLGLAVEGGCYLSGHTASSFDDAQGRMVVAGGMAEQARTAWEKVAAILEADDRTLGDVVRVVEYLTPEGIERYAEAEAVRREVLGASRPAVSTAPVKALLRPDALIEIEAVAGPPGTPTPEAAGGGAGLESDGLVYLPALAAPGAGRDVAAQTAAILDEAERVLKAMGLGLDHLVKTVDFVTPEGFPDYRATAGVRRERLGPVLPAATGVIVPRLPEPEALIRIDMIASRGAPAAVEMDWPRYKRLTYSAGVRAGRRLFLAGQGAVDPETGEMRAVGDVVGQAELAYGNVLAILAKAGGGPENLVKTVEWTTPAALSGYRGVAEVRKRLLPKPFPAATGPVCEAMVRPEMLFEVDAVAVLEAGA